MLSENVRAGALEENIALGANGFAAGDAVFGERAIEIAGAAAVQRVVDDARGILLFQFGEAHEFGELGKIRRSDIHWLECGCIVRRRESRGFSLGGAAENARRAGFDIVGDLGQGRAAVRG